ncbi:hypothetical protein EAF00_008868 [Botryotinia globosa]|nr:hypothetical protein EAF00_008868 [Botryotinia globosa]
MPRFRFDANADCPRNGIWAMQSLESTLLTIEDFLGAYKLLPIGFRALLVFGWIDGWDGGESKPSKQASKQQEGLEERCTEITPRKIDDWKSNNVLFKSTGDVSVWIHSVLVLYWWEEF